MSGEKDPSPDPHHPQEPDDWVEICESDYEQPSCLCPPFQLMRQHRKRIILFKDLGLKEKRSSGQWYSEHRETLHWLEFYVNLK
jgi:hypothetical protein